VTAGAATLTRARSSSHPRAWAGACGAVFVCSWGGNQFSPLLLLYEERSHYSALMVNGFLGVYVLGLAPALRIAGSLSDTRGRRPVMLAGVAAAVAGSAMLALGPYGAVFLAAGRLLSGVTVGIALAAGSSWIKELSQPPFDSAADAAAGARRSALAFSAGAALGALVAGLIAQWGPAPEVLPFVIHIAVTVPFAFVILRTPETNAGGAVSPGPWWRQLRVPSAGHRRFVRVVAVAAPWVFGSAALGYGYLPTLLRGATGSWGLVFATATSVVALGASSAITPIAKRVHSAKSARGLAVGLFLLVVGIAACVLAIIAQSVWAGLAANVVIGAGLGITMVSGMLEVQAIAAPGDLAGLTGTFYALAYTGFLAPAIISAIAGAVPVETILWVVVALAVTCWALVVTASTRHLPAPGKP
jgi:MFS family permease